MVSFDGIEKLNLATDGGRDTVRLAASDPGVLNTTISTGEDDDTVLLSRLGDVTEVLTGSGKDTVDIRSGDANTTLEVKTEGDADLIRIRR